MCRRSRNCTRFSLGSRTSHTSHSSSHVWTCPSNASANAGYRCTLFPALAIGSVIARSRDVYRLTIFSTRTGASLLELELEALLDEVLHLIDAADDVQLLIVTIDARASRLRDLDPGLACPGPCRAITSVR